MCPYVALHATRYTLHLISQRNTKIPSTFQKLCLYVWAAIATHITAYKFLESLEMLSPYEIHSIADALVQQKVKPTQSAIRKALGGGSYTTISEALRSWPNRSKEPREFVHATAPEAVTAAANRFAYSTWEAARNVAEERLTTERGRLDLERAEMEIERKENDRVVDALEAELSAGRAQNDLLAAEKLTLIAQAVVLTEDTQELRSKLIAAVGNEAQAKAALTEARVLINVLPPCQYDLRHLPLSN